MDNLENAEARVGFLESSVYASGVPVAYVAVIMENGYEPKKIPPRPIFAPTVKRMREAWRNRSREQGALVLAGQATTSAALASLAVEAAQDVQDTIAATTSPALKRQTIRARERLKEAGYHIRDTEKPLEATRYLYDSVTWDTGKADS